MSRGLLNNYLSSYDCGFKPVPKMPPLPESNEPKTWVKIPTLHPKAPNAMMLLGEHDLLKLGSRVDAALVKLSQMRQEAAKRLKVGDRVRAVMNVGLLKQGLDGIVLDAPAGNVSIRVAFVGVGAIYVGREDIVKVQ